MGQGQFLWGFKVPKWFFTVPGEFLLFQVDFYGFSWFQVGIQRFSRIQFCFSWFQVGFEGNSWFQVSFYSSRLVFHGARSVFMVPGRFLLVFQYSRLIFLGSR